MKYYINCLTCDVVIDFWKYDSISDTDHEGHDLEDLNKKDTINEAFDCLTDGCLSQEHMGNNERQRIELLQMMGVCDEHKIPVIECIGKHEDEGN